MERYPFHFEKLAVYNEAERLVSEIYEVSGKFPREEQFGLTNQLRRASLSICLNIAEGSGRKIGKEQSQFYRYSYSSLLETVAAIRIANKLGFVDTHKKEEITRDLMKLSARIARLSKSAKDRQGLTE